VPERPASGFGAFLRSQLAAGAAAGAALGLLLALLLLYLGSVNGQLSLDLEFERADALWFLALSPLLLTALLVILSPLSFVLIRLSRRLRRGRHSGSATGGEG
jgi:hypothetical protein